MFTVAYDEAAGIVRCTTMGFYSVAEVLENARRVRDAVARCQREFGSVAMLILASEASVQSKEVMEASQKDQWRVGPGDRMAIVLTSALARMQAARTFVSDQEKLFQTEAEAVDWLMAELPNRGQPARRAVAG